MPPPTDTPANVIERTPSLLESLPSDALVSVFDALPPATVAGPVAAASPALRAVAHGGDAWRLRFEPRLPRSVAAVLDAAGGGAWPAVFGALAGNLLAGAASWRGVEGGGMRAWLLSRDGECEGWWVVGGQGQRCEGKLIPTSKPSHPPTPTTAPPWRVVCHGGHGWRVEPTPEGAPPIPAPPRRRARRRARAPPPLPPSALAASFAWCEVLQEVDLMAPLLAAGLPPDAAAEWLDSGRVDLRASVSVSSRFDCGAGATVSLHADDGTALWPHYHGRPQFDYAGRALASWTSGHLDPPRGAWTRVRGTLRLPPGTRRALLVLGGRDTRFWAGHYGAKFAAPELVFGFAEGKE